MARNLPVTFAAVMAGAVLLDAAIKGAPISDVIKGQAASSGSSTATGNAAPGSTPGIVSVGAVNPFGRASSVQVGRTDMGVDYNLNPGDPIDAPFSGTVTAINPGWYNGQPQVVLQGAKGGPFANQFVYFAEGIAPSVKVGDTVNAGDQLGTFQQYGNGGEFGFAANAQGQTLAQATTGYTEGQATAAGSRARAFLASLGVNVG